MWQPMLHFKMSRLPYWGLIVAVCLVTGSESLRWDGFRCKFSGTDVYRDNSFFKLPRTISQAKDKGWITPVETRQEKHVTTFCHENDGRVCIIYDDKGTIAGYQIGIPTAVDAQKIKGINYEEKGLTKAKLFGEDFYIARAYFTNPDIVQAGGRDWDEHTGTGLWLPIGGPLVEIPKKESELLQKVPGYKKQNCFNKMGQHYFYNLSRAMTPEDYQLFYLLYTKYGELVGWGLNGFGLNGVNAKHKDPNPIATKREWFETVKSARVRNIAPDTADWNLQYIDEYGTISQHVYMVDEPWEIEC